VIPFGIDTERYGLAAAGMAGRKLRHTLGGQRIVLFVGRLVYYKGLPVLLRAMRDVDATLVLVGEGPDRQALQRLAGECGVAGRVRFEGAVDDALLPAYYQACDVFVLPSTAMSEGFGIVQLEAMASGRPVVSTSLPTGLSTVNVDGSTGLVVAPGDAGALRAAIWRILDAPHLGRRFGEAARQRVLARYDVEAMVDATLTLYRRLVSPGA
jgi:rhamnosyl/mannosyltransferase